MRRAFRTQDNSHDLGDSMTNCQACATEILGRERFCRNCGAPVAVLIEDLADTNKFESAAPPLATAHAGISGASGRFYTGASTAYPLAQSSGFLSQTVRSIKNLLRRKIVWPLVFLLVSIFVVSGLAIGRGMVRSRRAHRAEQARETERIRQSQRTKQAGIALRSVEEQAQRALGFKPAEVLPGEYPDLQGVFVVSLTSEYSPAALSNIQAGDVLTELNGKPVPGTNELGQVLSTLKSGAEAGVKLYRDGETVAATIRVADRSLPPVQPKIEPRDQGFLGVGSVTRRCCAPGTKRWGLEVRRLIDNSPADLVGLQLGDLITEFDGHPTLTPDEFARRILATKPRTKVKLKFHRGNAAQIVELILGHGW